MWIKICGCRLPEDAASAAAAGADAVGMVLTPGYGRSLDVAAAVAVRQAVPPGVLAVGVFVDEPLDAVEQRAGAVGLDAVQLHGREPDAWVAQLRRRWRVLRRWDLTGPAPAADWLVVEPNAGGSGRAWDWSRARGAGGAVPLVLAGGLTPENVAAACAQAVPDGVDVSSGVESGGRKDPDRMRRFCAAARGWASGDPAPRRGGRS